MLTRRNALLAASAGMLSGCSWFDSDTGVGRSCDWVTYDLNTGLDHSNSTAFTPVYLANGSQQGKWAFNNMAITPNASHDVNPIVVGDIFPNSLEPALPDTKWIKGTEDNLGGGSEFRFTYCFCVNSEDPSNVGFAIQNLKIKGSEALVAVWLNQAPPLFQANGNQTTLFEYDAQNASHKQYNDYIIDGLNCLHISVATPTRPIQPMGISVSGHIKGLSCCS